MQFFPRKWSLLPGSPLRVAGMGPRNFLANTAVVPKPLNHPGSFTIPLVYLAPQINELRRPACRKQALVFFEDTQFQVCFAKFASVRDWVKNTVRLAAGLGKGLLLVWSGDGEEAGGHVTC